MPEQASDRVIDPLGFDAGDSNLYRYVNNRPTTATDPSGYLPPVPSGFEAPIKGIHKGYLGTLSKAEIAKRAVWYEMPVKVYVGDFFSPDPMKFLPSVSDFYKKHGILIKWDLEKFETPSTYEYSADPFGHPGGGYYVEFKNPLRKFFTRLEMAKLHGGHNVSEFVLKSEPHLKSYWDNFDHVPTVFLVDDISIKEVGSWFTPDLGGLTFNSTLAWMPDSDAPWIADYDRTLAHEIGHMLGLPDNPAGLGVMAVGAITTTALADTSFVGREARDIIESNWLKKVPSVQAFGE